MMNRSLLLACLFTVCLLPSTTIGAREASVGQAKPLRAEIQGLRRLVSELSKRIHSLEKRLDRIEAGEDSVIKAKRGDSRRLRPLGDYQVDEHGIIWHDGTPVGVWGVWRSPTSVNGLHMQPTPRR